MAINYLSVVFAAGNEVYRFIEIRIFGSDTGLTAKGACPLEFKNTLPSLGLEKIESKAPELALFALLIDFVIIHTHQTCFFFKKKYFLLNQGKGIYTPQSIHVLLLLIQPPNPVHTLRNTSSL